MFIPGSPASRRRRPGFLRPPLRRSIRGRRRPGSSSESNRVSECRCIFSCHFEDRLPGQGLEFPSIDGYRKLFLHGLKSSLDRWEKWSHLHITIVEEGKCFFAIPCKGSTCPSLAAFRKDYEDLRERLVLFVYGGHGGDSLQKGARSGALSEGGYRIRPPGPRISFPGEKTGLAVIGPGAVDDVGFPVYHAKKKA